MVASQTVLATATATLLVTSGAQDIPAGAKESFVAPPGFPTSIFSSYCTPPVATAEPQPLIHDPVLNITYPCNLTDPNNIPQIDNDPVFYPQPIQRLSQAQQQAVINQTITQITGVAKGSGTNCTKCIDSLVYAKKAAQLAPSLVPDMMVELCTSLGLHSKATCQSDFNATTFGAIWTQSLYFADVTGYDGHFICNSISSSTCAAPKTSPLDTSCHFPKPKPKNACAPKPSGKKVKVLHM